jgi:fluoroacetyl-CoA thioesterase
MRGEAGLAEVAFAAMPLHSVAHRRLEIMRFPPPKLLLWGAGNGEMKPVPIGATGTYTLVVRPEHLANQFKDSILPQVFATPVMILIMENAALNAVRSYLDPGESVVGTAINVEHLAATPVGHHVTAEAKVTKVNGRRIEFAVTARDEKEEIGRGTHARIAVDMARLSQRLEAKRALRGPASKPRAKEEG